MLAFIVILLALILNLIRRQRKKRPVPMVNVATVNLHHLLAGDSYAAVKSQSLGHVYKASNFTRDPPIVIDSGASTSVTPIADDFVGKILPSTIKELNGLNHTTVVAGEGTVEWHIRDFNGVSRLIRTEAQYVPSATIRLFSPQAYFLTNKSGKLELDTQQTTLTLPDGTSLVFPYNSSSKLPLMAPETHFHNIDSKLNVGLTTQDLLLLSAYANVAQPENRNLTAVQRELMLWHHKLGHCDMQQIQSMARPTTEQFPQHRQVIFPHHQTFTSCKRPVCAACQLSKQGRRAPQMNEVRPISRAHNRLRQQDLHPGDRVSIDQYVSSQPGRLSTTRGKESKAKQYSGGTIFVDHASSLIYVHHQVSLRAGETVAAKQAFERFAAQHGVTIKCYHADNKPFADKAFLDDINARHQTINYSGVGAHHQNSVAERAIGTAGSWARTMLLHQILHWPEQANLSLWPFAFNHAVYLWNHLPKRNTRLSPIELFSGSLFDSYTHIQRLPVWGCPAYVLDPLLQDGKKIPKWYPRARRGLFLGRSSKHSSTIGLILNLRTGYITPQYHVVYDNLFETVPNVRHADVVPDQERFDPTHWNKLIETGYEQTWVPEYDQNGRLINRPPGLNDDWLTDNEIRLRNRLRAARQQRGLPQNPQTHEVPEAPEGDAPGPPRTIESDIQEVISPITEAVEDSAPEGDTQGQEREIVETSDETQTHHPDIHDDLSHSSAIPQEIRDLAEALDELPTTVDEIATLPTPPQRMTRSGRQVVAPRRLITELYNSGEPRFRGENYSAYQYGRQPNQRIRAGALNESFLHGLEWDFTAPTSAAYLLSHFDEEGYIDEIHPTVLATQANAEDHPTFEQAMNGPNKEGYWKACQVELNTLEIKKQAWDVVERQPWMNVLKSTWAFRCKRYPDGTVRKLKARFCARGDMQIEGLDFFETYAPVVNWQTVRILLIMSIILNLSTLQVDYTAAFLHAPIDQDPNWENLTEQE